MYVHSYDHQSRWVSLFLELGVKLLSSLFFRSKNFMTKRILMNLVSQCSLNPHTLVQSYDDTFLFFKFWCQQCIVSEVWLRDIPTQCLDLCGYRQSQWHSSPTSGDPTKQSDYLYFDQCVCLSSLTKFCISKVLKIFRFHSIMSSLCSIGKLWSKISFDHADIFIAKNNLGIFFSK